MIFLVQQKKSIRAILVALFLFSFTLLPLVNTSVCLAVEAEQNALNIFEDTAKESGFTSNNKAAPNVYQIIGIIVNIILGFVGVIFLVLTIAGGFMWMTAGGNDEKVTKGRGLILQSVTGLAIVLAAYLLANFVVNQVLTAVL